MSRTDSSDRALLAAIRTWPVFRDTLSGAGVRMAGTPERTSLGGPNGETIEVYSTLSEGYIFSLSVMKTAGDTTVDAEYLSVFTGSMLKALAAAFSAGGAACKVRIDHGTQTQGRPIVTGAVVARNGRTIYRTRATARDGYVIAVSVSRDDGISSAAVVDAFFATLALGPAA